MNEFVYCARLFYLEWVQGRWATNDDVEEGLYVHRKVDQPAGDLQNPEEIDKFAGRRWRSHWLSSPSLRLAAKIDVVEAQDDGSVVPVDFKKGSPDKNGDIWPSDAVQSAIQALLLREAGYSVHHAEVWYATVRQTKTLVIDDALIEKTTQLVSSMWQVAEADAIPDPLVDSPKCPRCSLVAVCLPDEINTIKVRATRAPRKIVAADPAHRPVYVQDQGSTVGVRHGRLEVFKDGQRAASYRLIDVSQLCVFGNITVTPQLTRELFARETPICWFSYGGWFSGIGHGLPSKYIDLRRAQFLATPEKCLAAARGIVRGKIRNSRTLLRRNSRNDVTDAIVQLGKLADQATTATAVPSLLGIEGTAARLYFGAFTSMLREAAIGVERFDQAGRNRRPPKDPLNALLSFLYAMLVKDLTATLIQVGLDPYLGVLHRPRYGRPALSLDLAEEFRPIIAESVLIQVINNAEVRPSDFVFRAGGCSLEPSGRKAVLQAYERRLDHEIKHPVFGYRISYRRALDVQARLLAAFLVGEVDEYVAFTTR